jgi:ubiquinol-cytochrome c reductase cytochrome b subunit
VPRGLGFWRALGAPLAITFAIQAVTGIFLALNYSPSPDHAYDSIRYIQKEVAFGAVLRGIHYFGASAMVILVLLHAARVFFTGAYKPPRELLWITGVFLLALTILFGFTGYLLPWDQKAYWATVVGTNIAESVPGLGPWTADLMRGGDTLGARTLTRFYGVHVLILPALMSLGIAVHLLLVHRLGIASPGVGVGEDGERDVAFFPDHVLNEMVVATVVFFTVFGLALIFGAPLEARANPLSSDYTPRPEWYFLGHYQLLKYLDGPLKVVGTAVLPGVLFALLIALPFLDRSRETRALRRPLVTACGAAVLLGFGVLTVVGAMSGTGKEATAAEATAAETMAASSAASAPPPAAGRSDRNAPAAGSPSPSSPAPPTPTAGEPPAGAVERGKALVASEGCLDCHKLLGQGQPTMDVDAPDLSEAPAKHDVPWIAAFLLKPKAFIKDATMDPFAHLSEADRLAIGHYLHTLKK